MDRRDLGKQLFGKLDQLRGNVVPAGGIFGVDASGYRLLAYRRFWPPSPELKKSFEEQLDYLRVNYSVRSLYDVVTGDTGDNTLCITVDGGHKDFFNVAYPALRSRGLAATVFLPTGFIDGGVWLWFDRVIHAMRNTRATSLDVALPGEDPVNYPIHDASHKRESTARLLQSLQRLPTYERDPVMNEILERLGMLYPPYPPEEFAALTWDEILEMWPNNISFGAQTVTHPALTSLLSEGEIHAEIAGSKLRVEEKLGVECMVFCYPAGALNERVVDVAKNCGFRGAVTNQPGSNSRNADRFFLKRTGVEPSMDQASFAQRCKVNS